MRERGLSFKEALIVLRIDRSISPMASTLLTQ
jgi:hypothetical protein